MRLVGKTVKPRYLRQRLGLNQQDFWSAVGVTQSGGSRYETGRSMPKPVRELVRLVHVEGIDLARARGEHFEIADHLRTSNPALYQRLKHRIRTKTGRKLR
ncbi:MAG: helix-turn-helix transcriptional regulator [Betaproteobacteria bacterium]|nr:helix-turn-helix transcriptional regulator [Betaproteobacteria bacterium]